MNGTEILPPVPWLALAAVAFVAGGWLVRMGRRLVFGLVLLGMVTPAAGIAALSGAFGTASDWLRRVDFASNLGVCGVVPLLIGGALALLRP